MQSRLVAAALAAMAVTIGPVVAQNFNRAPSFGTVNLNANFAPDPYAVNVTAGGTVSAERLGGSLLVQSSPGNGTRIVVEVSQDADDSDLANEKNLPDSTISGADRK